jgi:hypothetical protein
MITALQMIKKLTREVKNPAKHPAHFYAQKASDPGSRFTPCAPENQSADAEKTQCYG